MNHIVLMLLLSFMVIGLALISRHYRKTGAAVFAMSVFLFLAILPWQTVDLLIRHNRKLKDWATPRLWELKAAWAVASAGLSIILGFLVALRKNAGGKKPEWKKPEEFSGMDKAVEAVLANPAKGESTFLGVANGGKKIELKPLQRESHMQIVGPTRSGKSQLLFAICGQDMKRGMPVFFMEAKGDRSDFDQFLKLASKADRVESVRYFNPHDWRSMTFNPIRRVPGQDATAISNQIARAIGREPTSSGEGQDYYRSVDYAKIQNMAEIFCSIDRQFTLKDCFYYFGFDDAREKAFDLCADRRLIGIAANGFKQSPDSTALTSAIKPWTTGALGDLLNVYSPQIRLENIFEKKHLAYFAVPIGHLQVMANSLGRMVIAGLLSVASSRQRSAIKPNPASVILDEFAEFATPAFASFIATVGSAQFWTILSHQDLGQLKKVQGMDANAFNSAVFNNTSGCKICFRTPDPADAEFWSAMLGTYSTFDDTERIQKNFLGERKTGEKSRRMVEQFKVHPNRLKNLTPGTALIFSPDHHDCLAHTARVHDIVRDIALPDLVYPEPEPEEGLDLESAVPDPGHARWADASGVVK